VSEGAAWCCRFMCCWADRCQLCMCCLCCNAAQMMSCCVDGAAALLGSPCPVMRSLLTMLDNPSISYSTGTKVAECVSGGLLQCPDESARHMCHTSHMLSCWTVTAMLAQISHGTQAHTDNRQPAVHHLSTVHHLAGSQAVCMFHCVCYRQYVCFKTYVSMHDGCRTVWM
jgi:hypothetical protein